MPFQYFTKRFLVISCQSCEPHVVIVAMTTSSATPAPSVKTTRFIQVEWRFLLFGMIMAFWSSLGQTFFISLFADDIRAALSLTHGDFGTYYAIATTASAISLLWLGKLADTVRLEKLALLILASLCTGAIFFSQINSIIMLVFGLYFLRMFGQGMMTHVYSTAMARRYVVARGRAISIAQLGHTISESVGPAGVVALHALFDWRTIWIILPTTALILVMPFLRYLTRRTALQDGEGVDTVPTNDQVKDDASQIPALEHWRRQDVLFDPRFWLAILWLVAVPSFVLTGLLFHQLFLAEAKGVALSHWTASYVLYAVFAVIGSLTIGQLIDRFSARRVAPHSLLPNALACAALLFGSIDIGVPLFFIFFGLAIGMPHTANAALIAEIYGTRFMGEIKALFMLVVVFASALSPMIMGVMIDAGLGLNALLGLNIVLPLVAQFLATLVLHVSR